MPWYLWYKFRYKNDSNYGWSGDCDTLAKIQHLEGMVFDLESSERKLKKRILELQDREQTLQDKLEDLYALQPSQALQEIQDKDKWVGSHTHRCAQLCNQG